MHIILIIGSFAASIILHYAFGIESVVYHYLLGLLGGTAFVWGMMMG